MHKVGCLRDEDFIRACIRRTVIVAVLHSCQSFHYSHSFEDAIFTTVLALKSCLLNVHANKQCTDVWAHHVHTNAQTAKSRKLQQAQWMDTARHNISQGIGTMLINFQLHLLQTELQLVLPTSGVQWIFDISQLWWSPKKLYSSDKILLCSGLHLCHMYSFGLCQRFLIGFRPGDSGGVGHQLIPNSSWNLLA